MVLKVMRIPSIFQVFLSNHYLWTAMKLPENMCLVLHRIIFRCVYNGRLLNVYPNGSQKNVRTINECLQIGKVNWILTANKHYVNYYYYYLQQKLHSLLLCRFVSFMINECATSKLVKERIRIIIIIIDRI